MKIIELDETDSTNNYLKRLDIPGNLIVAAKRQTAGRGTKGRSFISAEGGVYLSVQRFYRNISPANAFKIMVDACVAVCRTIESFSVKPNIRWANDVLVGGKKISGTLIENSITSGGIKSIVGIGINVNNVIPEELKDTATSLSAQSVKNATVEEVKRRLIKNLSADYSLEEYKSFIDFFGSKITVITADGERKATALDVAADGRLKIMEEDGGTNYLSAAEVSLKS